MDEITYKIHFKSLKNGNKFNPNQDSLHGLKIAIRLMNHI